MIDKKEAALAQEPSPRGTDNALFQYIHHANTAFVGKSSSEIPWLEKIIKNVGKIQTIIDEGQSAYAISKKYGDLTLVVTYPRNQIQSIIR